MEIIELIDPDEGEALLVERLARDAVREGFRGYLDVQRVAVERSGEKRVHALVQRRSLAAEVIWSEGAVASYILDDAAVEALEQRWQREQNLFG